MWGQFTPGSKTSQEVAPKGKNCTRGITDCWKTGTHTTQVQDIDTGGRATLPVPGAVLEPPVLRQVAPRNARWRLRSRLCTLVVAGQITGLRTAGSELGGQAKGFLDRSSSLEGGSGHNTTSRFLGSDRKPCEPVATNCTHPLPPAMSVPHI